MAEIVSFPTPPAPPSPGSWDSYKGPIRDTLTGAGCDVSMTRWILADVERRWPEMCPPQLKLEMLLPQDQVAALKDYLDAITNAHITVVLRLEINLYNATFPPPQGGTRTAGAV